MNLKRTLTTGAAVLGTGFSLTSCGDDDNGGDNGGPDAAAIGDAPTDASSKDFCETFAESEALDALDSVDEQADAANDVADKMAEVGTPEGASESERNGFEHWVEFLAEVDGDQIEELNNADFTGDNAYGDALGLNEEEGADLIAFLSFAATTCMPDAFPSEVPTELPTE